MNTEHTEKKLAEDQKTYTKVKYIVRKRKGYTHTKKKVSILSAAKRRR